MNRDNIIRMARKAGFSEYHLAVLDQGIYRFADLVAAAEREACASLFEQEVWSMPPHDIMNSIRSRAKAYRFEWRWGTDLTDEEVQPYTKPTLTDDEVAFADAMTALIKAGYGKEAMIVLRGKA